MKYAVSLGSSEQSDLLKIGSSGVFNIGLGFSGISSFFLVSSF